MNDTHLEIKEAEINFIYSCVPAIDFSNLNFNRLFNIQDDDTSINSGFVLGKEVKDKNLYFPGGIEALPSDEQFLPDFELGLLYGRYRPINRKGISQYLTLKLDMGYVYLPPILGCRLKYNDYKHLDGSPGQESFDRFKNEKTNPNKDLVIDIQPLVRIFSNGTSCTLRVFVRNENLDTYIDQYSIHQVLHLVGMDKNCSGNYLLEINELPKFYSSFTTDYVLSSNDTFKFTLYKLFQTILSTLINSWAKKLNKEVILLCKENLIHREDNEHSKASVLSDSEAQSPWVVINLTLSKKCMSIFESDYYDDTETRPGENKSKALRKYQELIAPLVLRVPDLNPLDLKYEDAYANWSEWRNENLHFYNLYLDSRLFMQMSRRAILTMTEKPDQYPFKYHHPSLLDISEMTRTRWQTLIVLNYLIDKEIKEFRDSEGVFDTSELERIFNKIVQFTACLEDPASFVVSGDSLREIKEKLLDNFDLKSLIESVKQKILFFEKLYQYRVEIILTRKNHKA